MVGEKNNEREMEREEGQIPFVKGKGRKIKGIEKKERGKGICWRELFALQSPLWLKSGKRKRDVLELLLLRIFVRYKSAVEVSLMVPFEEA